MANNWDLKKGMQSDADLLSKAKGNNDAADMQYKK